MRLGEAVHRATQAEYRYDNPVHSASGDGHPSGMSHGNGLLNEQQAADLLNVKGGDPASLALGRKKSCLSQDRRGGEYDPAELDRFIASARRTSTSDPGTGSSGRKVA
jgi:hypothetical protein